MNRKTREAQAYYTPRAEAYRTSRSHGRRQDLDRMLELLDPPADGVGLDVATGGGHTALALAEHMRRVVATDATPAMLDAVAQSARERGLGNVARAVADAQKLPFQPERFDVVACRIAPHHFSDLGAFVAEAARVLRPGGRFYAFDLTTPEDAAAARVINRVETLRDPSHVNSYPPGAWHRALDVASLHAIRFEETASVFDLEAWIRRARMPPARERTLRETLRAHPPDTLGGYGPTGDGRMRVLRVEIVARKP